MLYNKNMSDIAAMLEGESGRVHWVELQPHFARGVVFSVVPELNLVHVASEFVRDNQANVSTWLQKNQIIKVTDTQAKAWLEPNPLFNAIVVAPWVLIQEAKH